MLDERYNLTLEENEEIVRKYSPEGLEGGLKNFPRKEKQKLVVLREITKNLIDDQIYDEKEINEILKAVFADFVTLRRYLIEYGFLGRKADGSEYWL